MSTIENIFPENIRLDGDTQPRAKINQAVCDEYGERMKAGEKFPPIDVFFDGEDYWLADGFHRIQAYVMAVPGEAIECNVHKGTQEDAQWYSYSVNRAHGLRRTNANKEKAVRAALAHPKYQDLSDAAVADHIGVRRETVLKYRREQEVDLLKTNKSRPRTGRDGRTINTAKIGKDKHRPCVAPSRQMAARIQQPTKTSAPMRKMTALNMPHDPVYRAKTLIEVFDSNYLRALVGEITNHLKGLKQ